MKRLAIILALVAVSAFAEEELPPIPMVTVVNPKPQNQVGSQTDTEWLLRCVGDGTYQKIQQPELKQAYCKGYLRGYRRHEAKMKETK